MIISHPHSFIFRKIGTSQAKVSVCIGLYNYANYILETLESIYAQTLDLIDLVIVDDCSQDPSVAVTLAWLVQKSQRFNHVKFVKHDQNSGGPSGSRNTGITLTETPFIFMIDADNLMYPKCLMKCLETLEDSEASFVYPIVETFGDEIGIMSNQIWNRERLAYGNYIDTMSLIRKTCLESVRGYSHVPCGWEDFELWCKFAQQNYFGVLIPQILVRYRVHSDSFLHSKTNQNLKFVIDDMMQRHPWLKLRETYQEAV